MGSVPVIQGIYNPLLDEQGNPLTDGAGNVLTDQSTFEPLGLPNNNSMLLSDFLFSGSKPS